MNSYQYERAIESGINQRQKWFIPQLKDIYYCPIEIIKELTDKRQFAHYDPFVSFQSLHNWNNESSYLLNHQSTATS